MSHDGQHEAWLLRISRDEENMGPERDWAESGMSPGISRPQQHHVDKAWWEQGVRCRSCKNRRSNERRQGVEVVKVVNRNHKGNGCVSMQEPGRLRGEQVGSLVQDWARAVRSPQSLTNLVRARNRGLRG